MTRLFAPVAVTEWDDIQALAISAFGKLRAAAFLLLRVSDAAAARAWLSGAAPTTAAAIKAAIASGTDVPEALQVALTAPGLTALGLAESVLRQFGPEFRAGMADHDSRSRRLGDIGANAPTDWRWGSRDRTPHVLVMLYAQPETLPALLARTRDGLRAGFVEIACEDASDMKGSEPFGFLDGLSQPVVDWGGTRDPGHDGTYTHLVAAGEVLLGYPNEYRALTDRPLLDPASAHGLPRAYDAQDRADLGRNGSYLVYRRLAQDVRGFWRWLATTTGSLVGAIELAEAMVGRGIDGQPVVGLGARAIGGASPHDLNDFNYIGDTHGNLVAIGAHIRRTNPRNADLPKKPDDLVDWGTTTLGLTGKPLEDAVSSTRFHRILRRGREYGTALTPGAAADPATPDPKSGLNFICLQASISRQFEFVQGAWVASAKFAGLSGESDPLLGNRCPFPGTMPTDGFTMPGPAGTVQRHQLPAFVTVEAGAYFFLPGLRALRYFAGLSG
jgi:deferrochelatase/peroxidase EfeB